MGTLTYAERTLTSQKRISSFRVGLRKIRDCPRVGGFAPTTTSHGINFNTFVERCGPHSLSSIKASTVISHIVTRDYSRE
ncbi:MAG: hypothetical protein A2836_02270 [Candidatus Taylorbacteria bacterium RIFCSPHIGHO2_01_FULL_45_63]|nr:MAG: hypothetical protein A2836_02270 [Candidatus Taylorbacteria bacterium RIFCSPHIGHO2_01_FULL_45_63]